MARLKRFIGFTLVFYVLVITVYWLFIRPAYFNWGATGSEIEMKIPGDEYIPARAKVSTRAIDINAPREKAWKWIVQTGQNRGGFHSYDWLENLFGANMPDIKTIHPEWQDPKPGDTVWFGENQFYGRVSEAKPTEYYSITGWTFYLKELPGGKSRLVLRYPSMEIKGNWFNTFYYYSFFEAIHFIMETRMMAGIKHKAETNSW